MPLLRYITHPDVEVDPRVDVPRWNLSARGRSRVERMLEQPWVADIERIVTSQENKAIETALILARHVGLDIEIRSGIGENDRSATGFVPAERYQELAEQFFDHPYTSVDGWERGIDAQERITAGLADLLESDTPGDIVVVGHGSVGTLWYCCLAGLEIDRAHNQPTQGHYFTVDRETRRPLHPWAPIDETRPGVASIG